MLLSPPAWLPFQFALHLLSDFVFFCFFPSSSSPSRVLQRKHWFVLTQDALEYYSSDEKNAKRLGMLVLTSLCTVIWPDKQTYKETGYWNVTVYGRKLCYRLSTKHFNEAIHWACAIQKVIESKAPVETPTQLLIRDIEENKFNPEAVESIYKHNSILKYTQSPLYAPLLPFQYGSVDKGYSTLRDEAVKIFNSIQQLETARDAVPLIQGVLQTCQDLQPLRDEVYCQLIKQTSGVSSPETEAHLRYWQLLTCMSCTFLPGLPVLKYLRFHLKRIQSKHPDTEADNYAAFIAEALEKTRGRELVPSWEEIHILMNRQEMVCTVHCPGQEVSQVPISSHTTAEEVVKKMVQHLGLQHSPNTFALYEQNCHREWLVASSSIVADVLTKFEKEGPYSRGPLWKEENLPEGQPSLRQSTNQAFRGHLPTSEEDLQYLSALRLQSLNGDFNLHAPVPPLEELFPGHLIEVRALASARMLLTKPSNCSSRFHAGFLSGALHNGLWGQMAAHKQKAEEDLRLRSRMKEEGLSVMAAIVERWKLLQGLSREDAITTYLSNVKQWSGFGSTLYDIDFYVVNVPTLWEKRKGSSACLNKHEVNYTKACGHPGQVKPISKNDEGGGQNTE
uniref:Pleckstrin homology, MyTH4 and FERM domain containing H3 n=1 Tax=Erpetoichthys calabaricus TaxID=27687 RepID=A0A8C4SJ09_ERPCA